MKHLLKQREDDHLLAEGVRTVNSSLRRTVAASSGNSKEVMMLLDLLQKAYNRFSAG
jgi:hypothetical protein